MTSLTVVPPVPDEEEAVKEAWGPIMDAVGKALKIPDLPPADRRDLLVIYRAAASITQRPESLLSGIEGAPS